MTRTSEGKKHCGASLRPTAEGGCRYMDNPDSPGGCRYMDNLDSPGGCRYMS